MNALRERMKKEMLLRRFAVGTQKDYLRSVEKLAEHYDCSPDRLSAEEVRDFLFYLLNEQNLMWSTVSRISAAIRFLYGKVLGRMDIKHEIPRRKMSMSLPVILSADEIRRIFAATDNMKYRMLLMTAYGAGLKASEAVRLKVNDIHRDRMMIYVEGKKGKDRYTVLPIRLLKELRNYRRKYRLKVWLFPSRYPDRPMSASTARLVYTKSSSKAEIKRKGSFHTLRHCFATHLLETGVELRTIQQLLGHSCISSTTLYRQLANRKLSPIRSPLDAIGSLLT